MTHNDDSFATMLLVSQIDPGKEELVRPLSTGEWHALQAKLRARDMTMGDLLRMDMSAFMMRLDCSEQEAYRLCVLLGRVLPLSMCLERFAEHGIQVVTWHQSLYPARLRERLGVMAPPLLYLAGRPELFRQDAIAVIGAGTVQTGGEAQVRHLVRMATEHGYAIVTDGAPGLSRIAEDEALHIGGRVIEVDAGGLSLRTAQRDMLAMTELRLGAAMTLTHPDAPYTVSHARSRSKCIYGLSLAAFIIGVQKDKGTAFEGAAEALQRQWTDFIYVWDHPAYPDGRELIARGAAHVGDIGEDAFSQMDMAWRRTTARQLSMFDREDPLA